MAYKILIADDEDEIRELLRLYLEKEGYEIFEAQDGLQALKLLGKEDISMALIDILMPGLDGFRLIKELRKSSRIPAIVI